MARVAKKTVMLTARVEPAIAKIIDDGCLQLDIPRSILLTEGALNELRRRLRGTQTEAGSEEMATPDVVSC